MSSRRPIADRVVAITGAGRGIGASTAQALVARGAKVAIGDIDLESARDTAARLGAGTLALPLDVTDAASFTGFLDRVEADLGPLDVLVNNAGIMPLSPVLDETDELVRRVLELNVTAMIRGSREAFGRMLPRGTGHVVNVASTAGRAGLPGGGTYCASKAAIIAWSEAAHLELHGTGVHVSCVMPGIVRTELASGVEDNRALTSITPEQVADAIVEALERPRFEVYVPRSYGRMLKSASLLPRPVGEWLGRRLGADRVFLDAAARPERKAYEERARGR